jgi:diguanylate cyclase (GGDEF)-like protein/PAS domain S-box-containing protein
VLPNGSFDPELRQPLSFDRFLRTMDVKAGSRQTTISSRNAMTLRFRPSPEMIRAVLDLTSDLVFFLNPSSLQVVAVNHAVCSALGWSKRELIGLPASHFISAGGEALVASAASGSSAGVQSCSTVLRRRDGSEVPIEASIRRLSKQTRDCIVIIGRHATELERHSGRTACPTTLDPLTGLPSRAALEDRLQMLGSDANTSDQKVALFFIDLDGFKRINDERGHLAGDCVLRAVGSRLTHSVRTRDLLVRFGGDEFVVLIEGFADESEAVGLADRILNALEAPIGLAADEIRVSASIGIAISNGRQTAPHDLLALADREMYRAKALGRNRHSRFPNPC